MVMINVHPLVIGCSVGVISAAAQALGLTLQRKSYIEADTRHTTNTKYQRGLWHIGVSLYLLSNVIGSSVQITTLPLIILSPLQAVGLVFNSLCAAWILHEPLTRQSVAGTLLVALGALIIAAFGVVTESSKQHNLKELLRLLQRPQFLLWMALTLILVATVLLAVSSKFQSFFFNTRCTVSSKQYDIYDNLLTPSENFSSSESINSILSVSSNNTLNNIDSTKIATSSSSPLLPKTYDADTQESQTHKFSSKQRLIQGLSYAVVCGILSAHSLLMAKSAVEILVRCVVDRNTSDLYHYQSYLIVFGFLCFAVSQLFFMNRGLQLCSTAVLYPLVFCVYNVTSILNSIIYFQQTQNMTFRQTIMIALGTLFILLGVLGLSWHLGWHDDLALDQNRSSIDIEDDVNNEVSTIVGNKYLTNNAGLSKSCSSLVQDSVEYVTDYNTFSTNESNNIYTHQNIVDCNNNLFGGN